MDSVIHIFQAHSRHLALGVSVLFIILISLTVANAVLFFVENLGDEAIIPEAATVRLRPESKRPSIDIASLNLFGRVEEQAAPRVVDAPETNLNLELQGVFTADDPDNSTAIVAERNKDGELYQIGERLPGNAILEAVHEDHILIRRGNRIEKLMFSDATLRQQFSTDNQAAPTSTSERLTSSNSQARLQNIRDRVAARRADIQQRHSTTSQTTGAPSVRSQIETYRERLDADPQGVMNELGVSPVAAGEARGYRISGDLPEQALAQSGLQQGDIILSVNGRAVGNVANDRSLIDQAVQSGRVRVEVQRNDRRFFLTVPIP